MKKKIIYFALAVGLFLPQACQDELSAVKNTNSPTDVAFNTEKGILQLATGGVFINGFGGTYGSINDGLGTGFQVLVYGMHDSMGDLLYVPWGNNNFKYLDNPQDWTMDDNSIIANPIGNGQIAEMRLRNDRAFGATNGMLVEWTYMYVMNNTMNVLLDFVEKTAFSGDAITKKNTLRAWAKFWKGYAYSRIGSMYIAGLINDKPNETSGQFVTNTAIIAEATKNFDEAIALLNGITSLSDYSAVLAQVIPGYCQAGKGGVPTPAAFVRNINTMKARNIIANKRVVAMTNADWAAVKALADLGITNTDKVFVIKTTANLGQSIIHPNFGAVGPYAATTDPSYFISERLIQDFRIGDKRKDQNFELLPSPEVNKRGRGISFGTRYYLVDGGTGLAPSALTLVHTNQFGVDDHYMAGSYEENELMRAEANIQLGNIALGVSQIDNVRIAQGAGLAAINPASTKTQALEELRSERRVSLIFRSLAFYDYRRNGIIDNKTVGGGRAGSVVLDANGVVNTNVLINYNYLSYWDVPQNELEFNPPASGSAVVISPN